MPCASLAYPLQNLCLKEWSKYDMGTVWLAQSTDYLPYIYRVSTVKIP